MNKFNISNIKGLQVYDSRGNPTVEVSVELECGAKGSAIAPSGASVGKDEAIELRDKSSNGLGLVYTAVSNVNSVIKDSLIGTDASKQVIADEIMISLDGTKDKSKIGSNAIMPTSLAIARAAASAKGLDLYEYLGGMMSNVMPTPMMNFINGGVHADNDLDIQEFMVMPISADSFSGAMEMSADVLHVLKGIMKRKGHSISVGDEGGFAPQLSSTNASLDLLCLAIEKAGYVLGKDYLLSLDIAASGLYQNSKYFMDGEEMYVDRLISFYKNLIKNYDIFSIEDPISEVDSNGFKKITRELGDFVQIVGDDYFVTDPRKIEVGVEEGACNAVLIKPNQIGTLSETLDAISVAQNGGFRTVMSHRSGDSEDNVIAHLAVGGNCVQIKTGGMMRSERLAKYNELIRIENSLGHSAIYSGSIIKSLYEKFRYNIKNKS